MLFPKDFPDKLRASILTSEVVGKKVKLKLRGKEFQGLCPFHNEKSPSFTVNDQKGFFHCFGCSAHGDIISFVMKNEGLEFKDAVQQLAENFGIPIPEVKSNPTLENKEAREFIIAEKICQFFEQNLYEDAAKEARAYLRKRALNSQIAKNFRLGFAKNSYENLITFLKGEGFSDSEIAACGVVGKNSQNKLYDKFRSRVVFPIFDKKNRVIAFGGRTIADEMPKYLNSAETVLFKKSQTLYNLNKARKAIFDKGFAVVVEGYMDAISLSVNGIENVVAGLGTALGEGHLRELFYITDKIVICLDGDDAGIRAAKRTAEIALPLVSAKKNIFFLRLPNHMDPDDFVKKFGAGELNKLLQQATPLSEAVFEFVLMDLAIDKNKKVSAENKAKIEAALNEKTSAIVDSALKRHFTFFFKDLLFALGRGQKNSLQNFNKFSTKIYSKPAVSLADSLAQDIIALILCFPSLSSFRDDILDIKEVHLSSEKFSHIKDFLVAAIEDGEENLVAALENSDFAADIAEIKNLVTSFSAQSFSDSFLIKFRILLLKDLLLQIELQYKDSLAQSNDANFDNSQKIKEIFDYKKSLELQVQALEKELI
jgi:DNA primase